MNKRLVIHFLILIIFLSLNLTTAVISHCDNTPVKIGVLARRGPDRCIEKWSPTAQYLTEKIPENTFVIVPLYYRQICNSVKHGEIDLILVNPSLYAELENLYQINSIATLKNLHYGKAYTRYGGLVFSRADRDDIKSLTDLYGKTFMSSEESSLGSWIAVRRELHDIGIDPYQNFANLLFCGTQDAVVYAVRDNIVDAGSIRTDTLERMNTEGKIDIRNFHIIPYREINEGFPFFHSTRLYPEWPFAEMKHTPDELTKKVSAALLKMPPDSPAATAAECAGWTAPLNYQPVHECLKDLKLEPYSESEEITLADVVSSYWKWILILFKLIVILSASTFIIFRFYRKVQAANEKLRESEKRYRTLVEIIPHGIQEHDTAGVITFSNPAHYRMLGYAYEEIIGKKIWDFTVSELMRKEQREYLAVMAKEKPPPIPYQIKKSHKRR